VRGSGTGRISVMGLVCYKPDHPTRLFYRTLVHSRAKDAQKSFSVDNYIAFLDHAHQRLDAPIVLIWDNLNVHRSADMQTHINARPWLHVIHLPTYAPDLNPTENVWSTTKTTLTNLAAKSVQHLDTLVRNRLRRIQRRPDLLDNLLTHTGLTLNPD
jgi:putative transposase